MNGFHARHTGLFEPDNIQRKNVVVVGAGSIGSQISVGLARAGVRRFLLVDFDIVSVSNLCRTVYRERDVGRLKVEALAEVLREISSDIVVNVVATSLTEIDDQELGQWIEDADLVLATTDHPPTQGRLGTLSYPRKPALFAGVYEKGEGGEVLFTLPDETPCYHCILGGIRGEGMPSRGRLDYGLSTGQLAAEPALGADILHVAVCATKIGLALLLRGTGCSVERILDIRHSVLFVGNAASWIWKEPFETVWGLAERRQSCVCRLHSGASTADLLDGEEAAA